MASLTRDYSCSALSNNVQHLCFGCLQETWYLKLKFYSIFYSISGFLVLFFFFFGGGSVVNFLYLPLYACLYRLAFALYLVSILLFVNTIHHGALLMLYMGLVLCLAVFTYGNVILNGVNNSIKMKIPFQDGVIDPQFGWSWWLTLATGVFSVIASVFILILNATRPDLTAVFFHHTYVIDEEFVPSAVSPPRFVVSYNKPSVHTHAQIEESAEDGGPLLRTRSNRKTKTLRRTRINRGTTRKNPDPFSIALKDVSQAA